MVSTRQVIWSTFIVGRMSDKRGGPREGAGRKSIAPEHRRVLLTVSVSPRTAEIITDAARTLGIRKGEVMDRIVGYFETDATL